MGDQYNNEIICDPVPERKPPGGDIFFAFIKVLWKQSFSLRQHRIMRQEQIPRKTGF